MRLDAGLAEEIFIAVNAGKLDSDWRVTVAVEGAVDDVATEGGEFSGVPFEFDVAVVPGGTEVGWGGHRGCAGGIVIDANFIDDQRVWGVVSAALMKRNAAQVLGPEGINGCGVAIGERDAHLYPAAGGQISGVLSEIEWLGEAGGELSDLESLNGVGEDDLWQVGGRDRLRREDPEEKVFAIEAGETVADVDEGDFSSPPAMRCGLPAQANGIGRSEKGICIDGHSPILLFEEARAIGLAAAVEVGVRGEAVVEDDVAVVVGLRMTARRESQEKRTENRNAKQVSKALEAGQGLDDDLHIRPPATPWTFMNSHA